MTLPKIAIVAALATGACAGDSQSFGGTVEPEVGRFRAHVATLASAPFAGRRGAGARKAAEYVLDEFRRLGLEPGFEGSYTQAILDPRTGAGLGRNVAARLVGSDPDLRDEWIIVGAHFDHLGKSPRATFPGADDNASGTAMLLEVARSFAQTAGRPRRSVLFVGFDLEEDGLVGSRFFVERPPVPLARVKLFVTADMIGRALGGVCREFVFAFGAETTPGLRGWVAEAARDEPIRLGHLGNDVLAIDRSDYGPFRLRKIPYLFLSTGENPDYHEPTDTSDTIDYPKAIAACRIIRRVLARAADADRLVGWEPDTAPTVDEAVVVRDVLRILEANRGALKMKIPALVVLRNTLKTLDGIIARGAMTQGERAGIVRSAQFLLYSVL